MQYFLLGLYAKFFHVCPYLLFVYLQILKYLLVLAFYIIAKFRFELNL